MTTAADFVGRALRRLTLGHPVGLARKSQYVEAERQHRENQRDALEFERLLRCRSKDARIVLGRARTLDGEPYWAGLSVEEILGQHWWVWGTTGGGKSFAVLAILMQLLRRRDIVLAAVDLKGELTELLMMAAEALSSLPEFRERLSDWRVIRPFDKVSVPSLRLTAREPEVAVEVQAEGLSETLLDALGGELQHRMHRNFTFLAMAAIHLSEPLPILSEWLANPATLARAARRLPDEALRRALASGLEEQNRESLNALRARLDLFFLHTRLALSTPDCVRFADCLERGVTLLDFGNPPAGCEKIAKFWAKALTGRLIRAVLSRPTTQASPRVGMFFEEFQEALASSSAGQFERFLALSRSRKVSGWFINQQPAQLAAVSPLLVKLLRTNTGVELVFRSSLEDARDFSHAFPVPDGCPKPAEERLRFARELTRLPQREALLWFKRQGLLAQRIRSPRLDLEELRTLAAQCPEATRSLIRTGTVSTSRAEVEKSLRAKRTAAAVEGPRVEGPAVILNPSLPRLG